MRLLVFEYACAGGEGGQPYLAEGKAMLKALVRDLNNAGVGRVTGLFHHSFDSSDIFCDATPVRGTLMDSAAEQMARHDVAWFIAPETGGALYRLTRLAESLGTPLIGCSSSAVEICSDKYLTAQRLRGKVDTPPVSLFCAGYAGTFPCVVKPADGAGSENIFFIPDAGEFAKLPATLGKRYVIQPFVPGDTLSAGFLSRDGGVELLGVCRQEIEFGRNIRFKGVSGPVDCEYTDAVLRMGREIKKEIPGLEGYWGIDFAGTEDGPALVEINPRLTSSYPLYSAASSFNIPRYLVTGMRR